MRIERSELIAIFEAIDVNIKSASLSDGET